MTKVCPNCGAKLRRKSFCCVPKSPTIPMGTRVMCTNTLTSSCGDCGVRPFLCNEGCGRMICGCYHSCGRAS